MWVKGWDQLIHKKRHKALLLNIASDVHLPEMYDLKLGVRKKMDPHGDSLCKTMPWALEKKNASVMEAKEPMEMF